MKLEEGVMIIKNGKAWGKIHSDGRESHYGWINIEDAPIHNPKYVINPTDVTWKGSHYTHELETAKIVKVVRETKVAML